MALPEIPAGQPSRAEVKRILPPEKWIEKQLGTLSAVGETNYRIGIAAPKKDPIDAGIKAQPKYAAMMKKDEVLARRERALKATNMDEWYAYAQHFAGRLVPGVTGREKEVHDFVTPWQPIIETHVRKIDEMPEVTDAEREARMLANLRGLKALKGTWR